MNEINYAGKHAFTISVAYHLHENWEFVYCTGGSGCFDFQNYKLSYTEGDLVVIPPNVPHSNSSDEGFTNIFFNMIDASLPFKEAVVIRDNAARHIFDAVSKIHYYYYSNLERKSLILSALGTLVVSYALVQQKQSDISEIVQKIEADILDNFSDCYYDLNGYLKQFPFNNDYLRKLFKRELGVTPNKYLINKRLQTSADLLSSMYYDSSNISYVSTICGFKDPLYFSRMFKKKYGMSPTSYAKKHLKRDIDASDDDQKIFI